MNSRQVTVTVTNRTIVRTILWIVATVILYKFLGRISHEVSLIFASFFLALVLSPVVSWMSRRLRLKSRVRATAAAYVMVIAVLAIFFALVIPPLVRQTRTFINNVPDTIENFQSQDSKLARAARRYELDQKITQGARDFASHYSNYGSTLLDTGKRIVEAVASILAVLVMTFMMLVEGPNWLELFWKIMPPKYRAHHKQIADRMFRGVTGFVDGQIILAVIAGIFAFIALEIASHIVHAGVNSLALAGIVAVFGLIPLFGNPLAATLVCLLCLITSVSLGLIMIAYFIIYFFIENHTFQPYIQSRLNKLTPLTVFVAAILGVGFAGLLGAIIAIPVASAIKVLAEDYFRRRHHQRPPTQNLPAAG
jgi:predicted PurR-regulated permease PerM